MHAMRIPSQRGTYALLIHLEHQDMISVGKLGTFELSPGTFIYIGSAQGPGGLAGRILRHLRPGSKKRLHWHIDWLLQHANINQVWAVESPKQLECAWSQTLSKSSQSPIPGFGASDCSCASHLYALRDEEHLQTTLRDLQGCQPEPIQWFPG